MAEDDPQEAHLAGMCVCYQTRIPKSVWVEVEVGYHVPSITSLDEFCRPPSAQHRIIQSFKLEKTFKIIKSNHQPDLPSLITKPHPLMI